MNTKIKVKAKNLIGLLKVLDKSDETLCTLSLDLDISKTTIKLLDNYSEDWDFNSVDGDLTVKETQVDPIIDEIKPVLPNNNVFESTIGGDNSVVLPDTYYSNSLGVKDYNSLATLVESIFSLYRQSPNIKFESGLFYNTLEIEYNNIASSPISIEHSLLTMIIETYYKDATLSAAIEDTVGKLKGMWISKELSNHPNTTSLTKILYGGKR